MSKIVDFRDRIIEALKVKFGNLRQVEWYDGIFDEEDVQEWVVDTPSAWVSVDNVDGDQHSTGEMNATLRCIVAIVDQDVNVPREADARVWSLIEGIADWARLNKFGDPNAGGACNIKFRRLKHPALRREGVALGIVEWRSTLTIGRNWYVEREFIVDPDDGSLAPWPPNLTEKAHLMRDGEEVVWESETPNIEDLYP
jgi:hypothetical protein